MNRCRSGAALIIPSAAPPRLRQSGIHGCNSNSISKDQITRLLLCRSAQLIGKTTSHSNYGIEIYRCRGSLKLSNCFFHNRTKHILSRIDGATIPRQLKNHVSFVAIDIFGLIAGECFLLYKPNPRKGVTDAKNILPTTPRTFWLHQPFCSSRR